MRGLSGTGLGRVGLFTFGVIALVAIGALALGGRGMLTGADAQPAKRAIQPTGTEEATPEPVAEADLKARSVKEPSPVGGEASASASVPAGAMMSLSVPVMGMSPTPLFQVPSKASP